MIGQPDEVRKYEPEIYLNNYLVRLEELTAKGLFVSVRFSGGNSSPNSFDPGNVALKLFGR